MIYSVTVTNHLGNSLELELANPYTTGIAVQAVKGLGSPKANINVTDVVTSDGGLFNSARLGSRNIVFTFLLLGNPSVEDSRMLIYKYFPIKKKVKLTFKTENRECYIDGYIETCEPNIFSKKETISVSVICPDPYFKSTKSRRTMFHGEEPTFEFPFENDSLTEPKIEVGDIKLSTYRNIPYEGDEDVGMTITINFTGTVRNLIIYDIDMKEKMKIDDARLETLTGSGITKGDQIIICTVDKKKSITLIRNGVRTNILNVLDKDVDWLRIRKGNNVYSYTVSEGNQFLHFVIENEVLYGGI